MPPASYPAAMVALHAAGCVHRRLRETSFVVSEEGVVKLIEFGYSGVPPREKDDPRMTLFRPPEYVTDTYIPLVPETVSDVWSLGALLVIMTTGGMQIIVFTSI